MQRDYMLEAVQELGRVLRAIINLKKSNPGKALEEIRMGFKMTGFRDKDHFDGLSTDALRAFLEEQKIDYRTVDSVIDLLLEEVDIKLAMGATGDLALLMGKVDVLISYTDEREKELKLFSMKRNVQRELLKELRDSLPS